MRFLPIRLLLFDYLNLLIEDADRTQTDVAPAMTEDLPLDELSTKRAVNREECDFCAVVNGKVPRYIVFQDQVSLAFLDRKPVFLGHCLLIPKVHYETISDIPDDLVGSIFRNAKLLARGVQIGLDSAGTFMAINNKVSQSVPHLHIHVVPRRYGDGLRGFFWPRTSYRNEDQMIETRNLIQSAIEGIRENSKS